MLDRIEHRGPDGRGIEEVGSTTLGHVRLAIQDVTEAAAQPFTTGTVTLAYNGEVWNVDELRAEFDRHVFRSTGDTEVVAVLLDRWGARGLDKIDGMFAMAWTAEHQTWVARDRHGKIPLYIAQDGYGGWLFASELKAFPRGLQAKAVPPGVALNLTRGTSIRWAKAVEAPELCPESVLACLRDGVAQRLLSDRPVCFLLSGGLDSSLVLSVARELHPAPVAYTAVLDRSSADLAAARRVAAELDVPLVEVPVPEPTRESVHRAVMAVENPMKAQVEIALAHIPLMEAIASDGYRVALSGEAADELFCGYGNMAMAASRAEGDDGYRAVIEQAVSKMARGNFVRVNKVMMQAGVEGRLPFMEERLVSMALSSTKATNPPGKKVLKEAARGVLPSWVIKRPKETFQGATGTAAATGLMFDSPVRYYNAEARSAFGWLPKE